MSAPELAPVRFPEERGLFDPPVEFAHYRESAPIRPLRWPDGEVGWLVTSYELVREVLGDHRFTTSAPPRVTGEPSPERADAERLRAELQEALRPMRAGTFINMDAPEHTRFRRALAGRFSAKYVARLGDRIEDIVTRRLDAMASSPRPFDLVEGFALPIAMQTICHVLGVAVRPEWHAILGVMEDDPPLDAEVIATYRRYRDAMREEVSRLREQPNDGVLSLLLADADMTEDEVVGVGQFLVLAGHHTTTNMMALGTLVLQRDRRHWDSITREPDRLPDMLEELIRHITVLQLAPFTRTALEDVAIGDVVVRAGERVQVSAAAANRDPAFVERPDEFLPDRDPAGHLAFGYGVHQCLGQHLARLELRIAFTRLAERFPDLHPAIPVDEIEAYPGSYPGHGVYRLPVSWGSDEEGAAA